MKASAGSRAEAAFVCGGASAPKLDGIDGAKSAFVAPTLLKADSGAKARAVHDTEVFGPVATIIPYKDEAEAFALVARGGGSLVASVFGDDRDLPGARGQRAWPSHGRILAVDPSIADAHTGHGIVMPQCHHGGPGRAGNGAELGGLNGLRLYHQRVAVQGSTDCWPRCRRKRRRCNLSFVAGGKGTGGGAHRRKVRANKQYSFSPGGELGLGARLLAHHLADSSTKLDGHFL